jgi:hypothetical protein
MPQAVAPPFMGDPNATAAHGESGNGTAVSLRHVLKRVPSSSSGNNISCGFSYLLVVFIRKQASQATLLQHFLKTSKSYVEGMAHNLAVLIV